ncbi:Esterase alnB [Cladobotryum mycophilum]|uniref:Esterase alnB n=1 Tax=Cladobotryum mycophilum TaxID=491253 RepID=A0ABR0SXK4_9HYPO
MRRVLALHGVGSSGTILRDQLTPLVRALDPNYEFVYLDGAIETQRGPGMAPYYPGPFYSYTTGYSPKEIRDALDDLDDFIQENGPFDGIIGFSQGASMAAAYLLDLYARLPDERPPFGFAVFLSLVAAFSPDDMQCLPIAERLVSSDYAAVKAFPDEIPTQLPLADGIFVGYLATTFRAARKIGAVLPEYDIDFFKDRETKKVPRVMHPFLTEDRIKIPTVHVTGKTDLPAMIEQSQVVSALCDQSITLIQQHEGGHAAPAKKADVDRLVDTLEWAILESANQSALQAVTIKIPTKRFLGVNSTVASRI